jgi:hypothetical protein
MASDAERHARRARERVERRRRRLLAVGCLSIAAATVGIARLTVSTGRAAHAVTAPAARQRPDMRSLPGLFHGYLLIADRGDNRMLLVDGAHRMLWMYPKRTPGMPFSVRRRHLLRPDAEQDQR